MSKVNQQVIVVQIEDGVDRHVEQATLQASLNSANDSGLECTSIDRSANAHGVAYTLVLTSRPIMSDAQQRVLGETTDHLAALKDLVASIGVIKPRPVRLDEREDLTADSLTRLHEIITLLRSEPPAPVVSGPDDFGAAVGMLRTYKWSPRGTPGAALMGPEDVGDQMLMIHGGVSQFYRRVQGGWEYVRSFGGATHRRLVKAVTKPLVAGKTSAEVAVERGAMVVRGGGKSSARAQRVARKVHAKKAAKKRKA